MQPCKDVHSLLNFLALIVNTAPPDSELTRARQKSSVASIKVSQPVTWFSIWVSSRAKLTLFAPVRGGDEVATFCATRSFFIGLIAGEWNFALNLEHVSNVLHMRSVNLLGAIHILQF